MTDRERALISLARAEAAVRVSAGAPSTTQAIARQQLKRAEEAARGFGLLPTEAEIILARTKSAREQLIIRHRQAHNSTLLPNIPDEVIELCAQRMGDAVAVAKEWALPVDRILKEDPEL